MELLKWKAAFLTTLAERRKLFILFLKLIKWIISHMTFFVAKKATFQMLNAAAELKKCWLLKPSICLSYKTEQSQTSTPVYSIITSNQSQSRYGLETHQTLCFIFLFVFMQTCGRWRQWIFGIMKRSSNSVGSPNQPTVLLKY